jgi:protein gp37
MGKQTEIAWTDSTFNPWIGCAKVSPGCANCYAETLMDKRMGRVQWGANGTRSVTSPANWKQVRRWNAEAVRTDVRRRVFCGSLCDWLEDRPDTNAWRIGLLELIELTHGLDWLMLTKRPENAVRLIQQAAGRGIRNFFERNPHVWMGTSVENQEQADKRIPHLLDIPARVRFLSMEPLLGPVNLNRWLVADMRADGGGVARLNVIRWVIVGGESGHNARPMRPEWARSIRDQCQAADVPFFFKQWGEWWPHEQGQWSGGPLIGFDAPDDEFYKIGKMAAGRLLDGREWSEFPVLTHS